MGGPGPPLCRISVVMAGLTPPQHNSTAPGNTDSVFNKEFQICRGTSPFSSYRLRTHTVDRPSHPIDDTSSSLASSPGASKTASCCVVSQHDSISQNFSRLDRARFEANLLCEKPCGRPVAEVLVVIVIATRSNIRVVCRDASRSKLTPGSPPVFLPK
jgi:hypothetical protein